MVAGSADMAIAYEESYGTLPGVPTWIEPFSNPEEPNPELSNNQTAQERPNSTKPARHREGNVLGTVTLGGQVVDDRAFEFVFGDTDGSPYRMPDEGTAWPSVTVYLSANLPGIQTDRFLQGVFPTSVELTYEQGEEVTMSISCEYADEDTTLTVPSNIDRVDEKDGFMWHSLNPTRNGTTVDDLQSMTLTLDAIARGRRNQSRFYSGAYADAHRYNATVEAVYQDEEPLELAYGAADATEPSDDRIEAQDLVLPFTNANGDVHEWTLESVQTESYTWSQLFGAEDLTDPAELQGTDVVVDVTEA